MHPWLFSSAARRRQIWPPPQIQQRFRLRIDLDVGSPSNQVKDGHFGACLMAEPALVADGVRRWSARSKFRHRQVPDRQRRRGYGDSLDELARGVVAAGADALIVHARKAWLNGLSQKEDRDIPRSITTGLPAEGRAA